MTLAIKTREIQYQAKDGTTLIGYFAAPESAQPVAGVIVIYISSLCGSRFRLLRLHV